MRMLSIKQHQYIRWVDNQTSWATQHEVGWHQKIWGSNHQIDRCQLIGAERIGRPLRTANGNMDKKVDQIDQKVLSCFVQVSRNATLQSSEQFCLTKTIAKKNWKTDTLVKLHHLYHLWTLQLYIVYEVISLLMCRKVALCYHDPKTCQ